MRKESTRFLSAPNRQAASRSAGSISISLRSPAKEFVSKKCCPGSEFASAEDELFRPLKPMNAVFMAVYLPRDQSIQLFRMCPGSIQGSAPASCDPVQDRFRYPSKTSFLSFTIPMAVSMPLSRPSMMSDRVASTLTSGEKPLL